MSDAVFAAVCIFLSLTGLFFLVFRIMLRFAEPKRREKYYVIVRLTDDNDPSAVISSALEKRNLLGETEFCEIIAVDCGISKNNLDFLTNLYSKNYMFHIVGADEIYQSGFWKF